MKKNILLGLMCISCSGFDDGFSDGGFGVDTARCIEIDTQIIDFGEFAAFDEPASQSIFIDNVCGEENGSINWTLDDPDEAFLLDTNYQGNTLTITVDTDIAEPGDWEAQISIDEPFSDKQHHIQLFATTLSDEEPSD